MRFYIAALLISSVAEGASVRGTPQQSLHGIDLDPSCFQAGWSAENAEEACANAVAQNGESCVWCSSLEDAVGACVSSDQSNILSEYMQCGDSKIEESNNTCMFTTKQSVCEKRTECAWCEMYGRGACVDTAEVSMMEKFGAKCGNFVEDSPVSGDVSCLLANIEGADAATCVGTTTDSGDACSWCSFQDYSACMSPDMAAWMTENAGAFGVTCGEETVEASAPSVDMSCLMANIQGADAETCVGTTSDSGDACSWCSFQDYGACMGPDMAAWMAENAGAMGVTCGEEASELSVAGEALASTTSFDVSCLMVNMEDADAETCSGTTGESGAACSWCSFQDYGACVGSDMAAWMTENAGEMGVTCSEEASEPSVAVE